ncbi:hypothetical protein SAMN06265337_3019 [Hymenobacter gelipurpurascens]|uniref:DUF4230 domain-containing protein n=1 Tax=Hymenobacter gelipurpurascens TaxID=89968 RepID=A0A212UBW3_9BACT|nr:hypothetical protein [Hymenobacter gelipurpurascens]SNC75717.1 hypothetical protein SAMN06265337_3019 [Hymenobacter gelipurpurascens]
MNPILRAFSVLLVVAGLLQTRSVQAQKAGEYMQLFYYGPQAALTGPIGRFSPAFKGKSEIKLANQEEYMKQISPMTTLSLPSGVIEAESVVTTDTESGESILYVKGKRLTPAEAEKYHKEQNAKQTANQQAYLNKISQYVDKVTNEVSKALNEAAADGWEVTQMASLPNGGLVYLMRKGK